MIIAITINLYFAVDFGLYVTAFGFKWIRLYKKIL